MNTTTINSLKKARGPYVIIATVVWEFFSYFGLSALLVLYLTQALHFSDTYAYSLFGAYSSLVFITPILGGWLADNFLGNRISLILGSILIMLGHFTLMLSTVWSLYLGLSFLIAGVGFFKASAICLIGEYYPDSTERNRAFILYYMGGNIGATFAPILCGYFAIKFSWQYGFAIAGIGMFFGLLILLTFRRYLAGMGNPRISFLNAKGKLNYFLVGKYFILVLMIIAAVNFIIIKQWDAYVLIASTFIALFLLVKIFSTANIHVKKGLSLGFILTLFGVVFWIFDQQGSSSISLFLQRFVNRDFAVNLSQININYLIPTPMFQSINPACIVLFGLITNFLLKKFKRNKIKFSSVTQVMLGMLMLTVGFLFITYSAYLAEFTKASMYWVIGGLIFISCAEIFIDPVILSTINKVAPETSASTLTAIYYLFVGAIANYLAAQVAKLTTNPTTGIAAVLYKNTYQEIFYAGLIMSLLLFLFSIFNRFKN